MHACTPQRINSSEVLTQGPHPPYPEKAKALLGKVISTTFAPVYTGDALPQDSCGIKPVAHLDHILF